MVLAKAARTYMQTCAQITPPLAPLMASYQQGVQDFSAQHSISGLWLESLCGTRPWLYQLHIRVFDVKT